MTIKRFEGQYVHEVIGRIREELGPDAVVLHTRWRNGNGLKRLLGRPQVEVWAGINGEGGEAMPAEVAAALAQPAAPAPATAVMPLDPLNVRALAARQFADAQGMAPTTPTAAALPVPAALSEAPPPPAVVSESVAEVSPPEDLDLIDLSPEARAMSRDELTVALLAEFNSALERMEGKIDRLGDPGEDGPATPRLAALLESGVDRDVAEAIVTAAAGRSVTDLLHDALACTGELRLGDEPRVIALVGPSGAGKTSTIAKLAGYYALSRGARVMLLSTDTERVGTFSQLQALGDLLQVPVAAAHNSAEAAQKLRLARRHSDLILVDTPACRGTDDAAWDGLLDTLIALEPDQIHLVVAATTKTKDVERTASEFGASLPLTAVAVTKLDESADHGLLLNLAWRHHLPFSFLGLGPNIPDDFEFATPERLVRLAWSNPLTAAGAERPTESRLDVLLHEA